MVSALVSPTWLRQQLVNGLKNIRLLDGMYTENGCKCEFILATRRDWSSLSVDLAARGRFPSTQALMSTHVTCTLQVSLHV